MQRISKAKCRVIASLSSRKMRLKNRLFVVEGFKSVADLSAVGLFHIEYFVATPSKVADAERFASSSQFSPEVYEASDSEMRDISTLSTPPDILAVCRLPERMSEAEILSAPLPDRLYLVLDGVQDPGNMGTIIRTAHWMGVKRIFASHSTVDLFNPKVIQSSMGSLASVSVDYIDIIKLFESNPRLPVAGLLLEGEDIYGASLPDSAFIVMGNEGNGVSREVVEHLTNAYTIPPFNPSDHAESLNVAIATAITLSEFRRKSLTPSPNS